MYSGLAMYMLRPPTSRGMPAFGWALSLRRVSGAIRSMASRIVCGPTEQLRPMTSAPQASRARAMSSGVAPYGADPVDADGHLGHDRHRRVDFASGADGLLDFVQVAEGLEDEQLGAAVARVPPSARGT